MGAWWEDIPIPERPKFSRLGSHLLIDWILEALKFLYMSTIASFGKLKAETKKKIDEYYSINELGHLEVDGFDIKELLDCYSSPLYVISERAIRDSYRKLHDAFQRTGINFILGYGTKANHGLAICRIMDTMGSYFDVVGEGEIAAALHSGASPSRLILNGNSKTEEELTMAVTKGFAFINVDNIDELPRIEEIARKANTKARVLIRIKPSYAEIAKWEPEILEERRLHTKFGVVVPSGAALEACRRASGSKYIELLGLHVHIGWVEDLDDRTETHLLRFGQTADEVLDFASQIYSELGVEVKFLDFGGGLNVARSEGFGPKKTKTAPTPEQFAECYASRVRKWADKEGVPPPTLVFETGRYLVQNAGILLGKVNSVKVDPTGTYVNVDASTNLIMNRLTGKFYYHTIIANKADSPSTRTANIVGPICGSYDMIARGVPVPSSVEPEDIIAVFDAGAYCESKASRFNAYPLPATVLIGEKGQLEVIRRRETIDDLFTTDFIPSRLTK